MGTHDESQTTTFYWDERSPLAHGLSALQVSTGRPVVVIVGWAAHKLAAETQDEVELLLRKSVVPMCAAEEAIIVTGGTDVGVMAAVGRAVTESASDVPLIGVAPAGLVRTKGQEGSSTLVPLEPAHRSFLVQGAEWGDEGPALVRIAEEIAAGRGVVVLAIGGGHGTLREIVLAARRRWPTVLVTGSDGEADNVAKKIRLLAGSESASDDPVTGASSGGCYRALALTDRFEIARALRWRLSSDDALRQGWTWFAHADINAARRKKPTKLSPR